MTHATAISAPSTRSPQTWGQFQRRMKDNDLLRLSESLNSSNGLFDRQIRERRWQDVHPQEVLTSTAINLIALHRAQITNNQFHLDEQKSLAMLTDAFRKRPYMGGVGLILWANAVWDALTWDIVESRCNTKALQKKDHLRKFTTMEIAWLIAGLLHMQKRVSEPWVDDVLEQSLHLLKNRHCTSSGLFLHADSASAARHRSRRGISNFADQIYSVFSLSLAAINRSDRRWLELANACAQCLVNQQGELGQWWWHYHSKSGKVAQGFPVYSVHQRAMAPMALLALTAAGGDNFDDALQKGARWLERNELGISLMDEDAGTVWRSIELEEWFPVRWARQFKNILSQPMPLPIGIPFRRQQRLKTNHETRPYEWGWSLYAGALEERNEVYPHIL